MLRRSLLALLFSGPFIAAAASDDDAVWDDWVKWFRSLKTAPPFAQLIAAFRTRLADRGMTQSEIDRRIDIIQKRIEADRGEWAEIAYNRIYTAESPNFNQQPNAFLVRMVQNLKPGKALDFGIGQGRNSVYLAQHGWDVTGFDVAEEGVAAARANAQRAGVRVNTVIANANSFDWGENRWDLVVSTYEDEMSFVDRIVKSLRPGGLIVIEDYLFDPAQRKASKPATSVGPNDLLEKYRNLRILHYEDVEDVSDWGARRKTRLVRLAAQKQERP
jgi:2-polyprenyl-3-methyl-5-hydroxy-6-metoxy-1,4-benzoquinol methylase